MKYALIPAACLALASLIGSAQAGTSVESQVQLKASVNMVCTGSLAGALELIDFTSPTSGKLEPEMGGQIDFTNVTCNYPAYVSIKTTLGALKVDGEPCKLTAAYVNCIQYIATLSWGSKQAEVFADGTAQAAALTKSSDPTNGPQGGPAVLQIRLEGPYDKQFVSGEYTDTLVLKIGQTL